MHKMYLQPQMDFCAKSEYVTDVVDLISNPVFFS